MKSYKCIKCDVIKPISDFPQALGTKLGHRKQCKSCRAEYYRNYYKKNPDKYEKHKRYVSKNDAKYAEGRLSYLRHGLSESRFEELRSKFNGLCWICKKEEGVAIDHDHSCCPGAHSCGKCVRGVLCISHNLMLGIAKDDLSILTSAIEYLKDTKETNVRIF